MRAAVVTRFGGPEVLELRDEPEPEAGRGQLLVSPEAIGVNYRDIYEREGRYGGEAPLVAGVEGAGSIVAIGGGVTGLDLGGPCRLGRGSRQLRGAGRCAGRKGRAPARGGLE
jgi:NADPH2:quinone reductase